MRMLRTRSLTHLLTQTVSMVTNIQNIKRTTFSLHIFQNLSWEVYSREIEVRFFAFFFFFLVKNIYLIFDKVSLHLVLYLLRTKSVTKKQIKNAWQKYKVRAGFEPLTSCTKSQYHKYVYKTSI